MVGCTILQYSHIIVCAATRLIASQRTQPLLIMKNISLAARYRPQNFAQVAGQDIVKAVLSRAAAEDRPAPAYLLSGTRGVGKTTIARIFAKALNCAQAPCPEPCNECEHCRKITQGIHIDVAEIDGASNNSVEDARALRETIGYAPMEGRYKIFIIDEAHMLSRNAFNALLKTLEEPPEHVVFIFATTEAHKFPITIVSRCQHFIFRHLDEDALFTHLSSVLRKEAIDFEDGAVRLIARRAAGSVRDAMSLLDQALALGDKNLSVETTRRVLGLASQELFATLFDALRLQDCAAVAELSRHMFHGGIDIGFFSRELAANLRNLFLLAQGGTNIAASLRLPADELAMWQKLAPQFSPAYLHAAWQMALNAQRGIVQSPEPAAALELLLLNLTLLPRLLPVGLLSANDLPTHNAPTTNPQLAVPPADAMPSTARPDISLHQSTAEPDAPMAFIDPISSDIHSDTATNGEEQTVPRTQPPMADEPGPFIEKAPTFCEPPSDDSDMYPTSDSHAPESAIPYDWSEFCKFCATTWQNQGHNAPSVPLLRSLSVQWQGKKLILKPSTTLQLQQLERDREHLQAALRSYSDYGSTLEIVPPRAKRSEAELIKEFSQRPELQNCLDVLHAQVKACRPIAINK